MKILKKEVTCGEKHFTVAVDREIAVNTLEKFPDLLGVVDFTEQGKLSIADVAKKKKLGEILSLPDVQMDAAKYALPLMLKKAGGENADAEAKEIFAYAEENEVDDLLRDGLFAFVMEAFSLGERTRRHKVTFAMK